MRVARGQQIEQVCFSTGRSIHILPTIPNQSNFSSLPNEINFSRYIIFFDSCTNEVADKNYTSHVFEVGSIYANGAVKVVG